MGRNAAWYRIRTRNEKAISDTGRLLLREFAAHWRDSVARVTAEETQRIRASHLRAHILPALGHLPMNAVNQRLVQEFVNSLYEKLSDKSAKNTWATLRSLLAAAEAEELLRRIPRPKLRRVVPRDQPRFSLEEMRAIVQSAPNPELRALLALLSETGCRIEEALNLEQADVAAASMVRIRGSKTAYARRNLTISADLYRRLRQLGQEKLFPKSPTYYRTRFQDILRYLAVNTQAKAPFHGLRRANKSLMRRVGVPREIAMYRLGHGRGSVHDAYDQVEPGEDREWAERIAAEIYEFGPEMSHDVEHVAEFLDHTTPEAADGLANTGPKPQYRQLLVTVKP